MTDNPQQKMRYGSDRLPDVPVILETDDLAERERLDAILSSTEVGCGSVDVSLQDPGPTVRAHVEFWPLGAGAHAFSYHGTGMRLTQTARHVRLGPPDQVSFAVHERGWGRSRGFGQERELGRGDLLMTDLTGEHDYQRVGDGGTRSVGFDLGTFGLGVDHIQLAGRTFLANPLLGLLREHVSYVVNHAERLSTSPAAAAVGAATADLARAFLLAAQGGAAHRQAMHDTLPARITRYIRAHLTDPDLTPARIATHHNISVRHLHAIWSAAMDSSLEQWIMAERLAGARDALTSGRPIAAIAHEWGFADSSHFTRRFRQAFGMPPRDWRTGS